MHFFTNRAIWLWLLMGGMGYIALPWFAIQDTNGLLAIPQVFGGKKAGNGLVHAALFGRPWLWLGLVGLVVAGAGAFMPPGRKQGAVLLLGGGFGLIALLACGFLIGARGWAFESITAAIGAMAVGQPGMGWGGFVALTALLVLAAFGLARLCRRVASKARCCWQEAALACSRYWPAAF